MLNDEARSPDYGLFDHSGAGGSWNGALIADARVARERAEKAEKRCEKAEARAEKAEAEAARLRPVVEAFAAYRQHVYFCEDCADGDSCEEGCDLYEAALQAVDAAVGRPKPTDSTPADPIPADPTPIGHSLVRELRAALDEEDAALRKPATMENVFLADALVASRKEAERDLWEWAGETNGR